MLWAAFRGLWADVRELWAAVQGLWETVRGLWANLRELWAEVRGFWATMQELWAAVREPWATTQRLWKMVRGLWAAKRGFWVAVRRSGVASRTNRARPGNCRDWGIRIFRSGCERFARWLSTRLPTDPRRVMVDGSEYWAEQLGKQAFFEQIFLGLMDGTSDVVGCQDGAGSGALKVKS